ncbi:protein with unknown function [Trypanosoma cruzi Dm28c]|uniref:Transmembrane protein n=1 Tax=Trypanosoma cruzi Dm28c TaxID=1416333 RepID=V5DG22_TRYCR|nr:protein with unknown function [Trypanosoma cruzi Dm28c]
MKNTLDYTCIYVRICRDCSTLSVSFFVCLRSFSSLYELPSPIRAFTSTTTTRLLPFFFLFSLHLFIFPSGVGDTRRFFSHSLNLSLSVFFSVCAYVAGGEEETRGWAGGAECVCVWFAVGGKGRKWRFT